MIFDAFWLPGLPDHVPTQTLELSNLRIRFPLLAPEHIHQLAHTLQHAARNARALDTRTRVQAIHAATQFLRQPAGAEFHSTCQLVSAATGYSEPMTRYVLQRMACDWSEPALARLIGAEFPDPAALDGFVTDPHSSRRCMAVGPRLMAQIFSGNVPGVAVSALIRALLVKAPTLGKTALLEPVLPVLFARALHEVQPELANTIAVTYWPGGTTNLEAALFSRAELITVYGGATALDAIRKLAPPEARLVVHGPRLSLGIVYQDALADAQLEQTASDIALAVATFDQQGCVSPHLVYVIGAPDAAERLARALAAALAALESDLPRGQITPSEAVAIHNARARADFDPNTVTFHGPGTTFTVVLDPDDRFEASCLNRFIYVKPVPHTQRLAQLLTPVQEYLQSVALIGFGEPEKNSLCTLLAAAGASRITSFQHLPWPPPAWHHDGASPLRELIRWVDVEI